MKALILAAGLGTRLRPLTEQKPKALVVVAGKPMLEWVIMNLIQAGINEIIINIHHFPDQVLSFLDKKNMFGIDIRISDESSELLDSGGAILKAAPFLDKGEAFLVHNVDIVTNLDVAALVRQHSAQAALATLAVRERKTSRYLLFDEAMRLHGWQNTLTGEHLGMENSRLKPLSPFAFSGVSVISPEIFPLISETGKFSLIALLLRLAPDHNIHGYCHRDGWWFDLGKPENLDDATAYLTPA